MFAEISRAEPTTEIARGRSFEVSSTLVDSIPMRHGFRRSLGIRFSLVLFLGSLVVPLSGCGGSQPEMVGEGQAAIPATLKQSNDNMENFMKSQAGAKRQNAKKR